MLEISRKFPIMSVPKISIITPILVLLGQPSPKYQPLFPGVELLPETGDSTASVENVRRLYREGFTYMGMLAGPGGVVLQFQTGEAILLTGFALGGGPKTEALALAASEIGLGEFEELVEFYASLKDWHGPIPK